MASQTSSFTAGAWVAGQRRQLGLTQEQLAERACLSLRQLQRLEQGKQPFVHETIDKLGQALGLDSSHLQHFEHLALRRRKPPPPAVEQVTRDMIDALNPHLAGVVDWNWNILAANRAYLDAFPGLEDWNNVLLWFMCDPRSKTAMVEWEAEAILTIRWWKHSLVLWGENEDTDAIFQKCSESQLFRDVWSDQAIEAERSREVMLIRDEKGVTELRARLYTLPVADGTLYYLGIRL